MDSRLIVYVWSGSLNFIDHFPDAPGIVDNFKGGLTRVAVCHITTEGYLSILHFNNNLTWIYCVMSFQGIYVSIQATSAFLYYYIDLFFGKLAIEAKYLLNKIFRFLFG